MANHKSAKKRARQDIKRNMRNKSQKSATKTCIKKLRLAISSKDKEKSKALLLETQKMLSKLSTKGIIHKKAISRKTSRLSHQVAQL